MKNRIFGVLGVFVLILAASQIYAFSTPLMEANIPFAFTVEGKTLPAGQYTIERIWSSDNLALMIRSDNGRYETFFTTQETDTLNTPKRTELVFDKIGNHYFLKELWVNGENIGREVPEAKAEKELRTASLTPHQVSVLARG